MWAHVPLQSSCVLPVMLSVVPSDNFHWVLFLEGKNRWSWENAGDGWEGMKMGEFKGMTFVLGTSYIELHPVPSILWGEVRIWWWKNIKSKKSFLSKNVLVVLEIVLLYGLQCSHSFAYSSRCAFIQIMLAERSTQLTLRYNKNSRSSLSLGSSEPRLGNGQVNQLSCPGGKKH